MPQAAATRNLNSPNVEEVDIRAPLYYVLGRDIDQGDLIAAHFVFTITPCATGVVSRHTDKILLQPFVFEVLKAEDESACKELAAHLARTTGMPMLTVGDGKEMTAVYHDGKQETINVSAMRP